MTPNIIFEIEPESLATSEYTKRLNAAILAAITLPDDEKERASLTLMVGQCALLLSVTHGATICYERVKPAALVTMKKVEAVFEVNGLTPIQRWERYQAVPYKILNEWVAQFEAAQYPFEPDPAGLPLAEMSAAQRKELENPNSPLA